MIKIDLHLHTIASKLDSKFNFSLDKMNDYVNNMNINAIAITNHNLFDINNYNLIKSNLKCLVLPGIEVSFTTGHLLVISDTDDVDEFSNKCIQITKITDDNGFVSYEEFISIFNNLNKYIIIPHYDKSPKVQDVYITKLSNYIFNGEVANSNKFVRMMKSNDRLVPVLFSDIRIKEGVCDSTQQTYLDINDTSFLSIKEALKDKTKVFLNKAKNRELFTISYDGILASTGLNIIFGKRSSGKTYTLDNIYNTFNQNGRVKYIRQFELIEKDKDSAQKKFDDKISKDKSLFLEDYFKELKEIVESINNISLKSNDDNIEKYVKGLVDFARESDNLDSFAKVPIFSEQEFEIKSLTNLENLIKSTQTLLDSEEYYDLINNFLGIDNLKKLLFNLVKEYKSRYLENVILGKSNKIIDVIKNKLSSSSGQNPIPSFSFLNYVKDKYEINYFNMLTNYFKSDKPILSESVGKFQIKAIRKKLCSASELQKIIKKQYVYKSAFSKYNDNGYEYLLALKDSEIEEGLYYKCFADIDYEVLNSRGLKVSGGERAEFNLEEALKDAEEYDILLIDEPESSFDNLFLKNDINNRIKKLSTKMPVFISTHNSVVGGSIKADYIIYTEASFDGGTTNFNIYTGEFSSNDLISLNGNTTKIINVLLNYLEGGNDSYEERKNTYETFKNRE